jgi:hypothetical protein
MTVADDCIFASDQQNGRILKLDTDLNLLGTIGQSGQGPEEFAGIGCLAVYKDTVMAVNFNGVSLNSFTKDGHFTGRYSFANDPSIMEHNFCIDNEGFLYFASKLDSFPIMKYDRQMNRLYGFGEWISPENKEFRNALNNYLVSCIEDKIITIQEDAPIINLYEKEGKHLLRKELPAQLFEKRLKFKENEQAKNPANLKKTYILFASPMIVGNTIYLLYIDHNDQNLPVSNKVVELLYENNEFTIKKVYSLSRQKKDWFVAIAVTEDKKMIAANASQCKLCIYQLE